MHAKRSPPQVFISYITKEQPLAASLKVLIERSLPGVSCFAGSLDLRPGQRWLQTIDQALKTTRVLIVLCSPNSLSRPWVNFETGCAWGRKLHIIPVCHSGQRFAGLPHPFSELQGLDIDDGTECTLSLIKTLSDHLGIAQNSSDAHHESQNIQDAIKLIPAPERSYKVIKSSDERTRLINADLRQLLGTPQVADHTVWISAFLSAFAVGVDEPPFDVGRLHDKEYLHLLLEERHLLISLAKEGCNIKCLISPASPNHVRSGKIGRALTRTETLLRFLESDECRDLEHIQWATSEMDTTNSYLIGEISYIQGYKTGTHHGYGLTLRQTTKDVIVAQRHLSIERFKDSTSETIVKWSRKEHQKSGGGDREVLRLAVCQCLQESLLYLKELATSGQYSGAADSSG